MVPRRGARPRTHRGLPHSQLEQQPDDPTIRAELSRRAFALPGVREEASGISVPGATALVLSPETARGPESAFMVGREFAHLHPAPDLSLHLTLPEHLAAEVVDAGWGELHPLVTAGRLPPTHLMVYAPRDRDELEVVWELVERSYTWARGTAEPGP